VLSFGRRKEVKCFTVVSLPPDWELFRGQSKNVREKQKEIRENFQKSRVLTNILSGKQLDTWRFSLIHSFSFITHVKAVLQDPLISPSNASYIAYSLNIC
jgi:hypothetical protein